MVRVLANEVVLTEIVALAGGLVIAAVWIIVSSMRQMRKAAERQETMREIAAYVAEGSITPAEGERLMRAAEGKPAKDNERGA